MKLNIHKSTGWDNIGPRFLSDGADALTNIITHLVNLSISNKIVPDCTKVAKVTPIHKKDLKLDVGNYSQSVCSLLYQKFWRKRFTLKLMPIARKP